MDGRTNLPNVRAFGCKGPDGYRAMILNMETTGQRAYSQRFDERPIEAECAINLDADMALEYQDMIPNQSTQLLVFDSHGALVRKHIYGLKQARAGRGPMVVSTML